MSKILIFLKIFCTCQGRDPLDLKCVDVAEAPFLSTSLYVSKKFKFSFVIVT